MGNLWSAERYRIENEADCESEDIQPKHDIRSSFQHDHDRILFSTPVRRLADKTQVWPMDENDGVRTRLTHSHEVANLARSIGARLSKKGAFEGQDLAETIQPILQAIGLAHDLGNPPFGHQGEAAIGQWFKRNVKPLEEKSKHLTGDERRRAEEWEQLSSYQDEFIKFDGNAQTFRLLVCLQAHTHGLGLDLTAATLAAALKYPVNAKEVEKHKHAQSKIGSSLSEKRIVKWLRETTGLTATLAAALKGPVNTERVGKHKHAQSKIGYFLSEERIVKWLRETTGLGAGQRHPLTWIMEACDDIAYSVLDVDDILKKGIISPDDVLISLEHDDKVKEEKKDLIEKIRQKFEKISRSQKDISLQKDIKIQDLRALLIDDLIESACQNFLVNRDSIFNFTLERGLLDDNALCLFLKGISKHLCFNNEAVLRQEAIGASAIDGLMSAFWKGITDREDMNNLQSKRRTPFSKYMYSLISPNYLVCAYKDDDSCSILYKEMRLLTDMISGMTDSFALNLWHKIQEIPQ